MQPSSSTARAAPVLYQTAAEAPRYPGVADQDDDALSAVRGDGVRPRHAGRRRSRFPTMPARQPPTKMRLQAPARRSTSRRRSGALVTKSANDVAVAVGEYLGGSEDQFAAMMTAKARQIGMRAHDLPQRVGPARSRPDHDGARHGGARHGAAQALPATVSTISRQRDFSFRGRTVRGHNDLIGRVDGVDGIKTGYIRASGFNIVTSVSARRPQAGRGGDGRRQRAQPQRQHGRADRALHAAGFGGRSS